MTLLLRRSRDLPPEAGFDWWFATTGSRRAGPEAKRWRDVAVRLEEAYDACRDDCWEIGRRLAAEPGAGIARTPTMGGYGTDFRLMLAWVRLADALAGEPGRFLMICDDPWLFREIAARSAIEAGAPPRLWPRRTWLRMRGWLSRAKCALRLAGAAIVMRRRRGAAGNGMPSLLVYGHPGSDAAGRDAYFGDLMIRIPETRRILHVDCTVRLAKRLAGDGRTASLHGWGRPSRALRLVAARWRRGGTPADADYRWLVRRAVEVENGGAGPAMIRWQLHCQERWLDAAQPRSVAWPWENFAWERGLCRAARRRGVPTIGYQHTVVGAHQLNFSVATNPDGLASIPDVIACNGEAYRKELERWGLPAARLRDGGAFRIPPPDPIAHDPAAPVFFALSGLVPIAEDQMIAAARVAASGRDVLVRDHPMYPMDFAETDRLRRARSGLTRQERLSAVVYSTGTSGLEAILAGLPTIRLLPDDRIAVQILPDGVAVPTATLDTIVTALAEARPPAALRWTDLFAPPDPALWADLLLCGAAGAADEPCVSHASPAWSGKSVQHEKA